VLYYFYYYFTRCLPWFDLALLSNKSCQAVWLQTSLSGFFIICWQQQQQHQQHHHQVHSQALSLYITLLLPPPSLPTPAPSPLRHAAIWGNPPATTIVTATATTIDSCKLVAFAFCFDLRNIWNVYESAPFLNLVFFHSFFYSFSLLRLSAQNANHASPAICLAVCVCVCVCGLAFSSPTPALLSFDGGRVGIARIFQETTKSKGYMYISA